MYCTEVGDHSALILMQNGEEMIPIVEFIVEEWWQEQSQSHA
jgi:hypothetical protein